MADCLPALFSLNLAILTGDKVGIVKDQPRGLE